MTTNIIAENIPSVLKSFPRWMVWKLQHFAGEKKPRKVPFHPVRMGPIDPTNQVELVSFDTALKSYSQNPGEFQGIGFSLGVGNITCIDLDNCFDAEGNLIEAARMVINRLPKTYIELSQSGQGLHIFVFGKLPDGRRKGRLSGGTQIEMYDNQRYIAMTGNLFEDYPSNITGAGPELVSLHADIFPDKHTVEVVNNTGTLPSYTLSLSDSEIIDKMLKARNGAEINALWQGDISKYGDDESAADEALLCQIVFYTREKIQIERIFSASALGQRGKWQNRPDYRERSIDNALGFVTNQYSSTYNRPPQMTPAEINWPEPDRSILKPVKHLTPQLPLDVFGNGWSSWLKLSAASKSAPVDYVALSLIAVAGGLMGNAAWASPWPGWEEPPVLWVGLVGNPSSGKSPGLDAILNPLRDLEAYLKSQGMGKLRLHCKDTTTEALARIHAKNHKGIIVTRDELAGWVGALDKYGGGSSDRPFYLEAYGGRSYTIDRVKQEGEPITVPYLIVTLVGGIQPDKVNRLILSGDDDGLAARFNMVYPEPVMKRRPSQTAEKQFILDAFIKLQGLTMRTEGDDLYYPRIITMEESGMVLFESFLQANQEQQDDHRGLLLSYLGKLPGTVLRLSNILEHLWWSVSPLQTPPSSISLQAVQAAIKLVDEYLVPMARKVLADSLLPQAVSDAMMIAKRILSTKASTINANNLNRELKIGSERVSAALALLEDVDWIKPSYSRHGTKPGRQKLDYLVNPKLLEEEPDQAA